MRAWQVPAFGVGELILDEVPRPEPAPGEIRVALSALSLNYRDLMVVEGLYNPKFKRPFVPLSDGAGVVTGVGKQTTRFREGDRVLSHFIADWISGPFEARYGASTLGAPGPGLAAEEVCLPEHALVPLPLGYDFAQAATLPIAALTAWSGLIEEGELQPGQTMLTLGTGGVSIFAVQIAHALGARAAITSSSDEKLERAKALGASITVNYKHEHEWQKAVLGETGGEGVDVTLEIGGAGTLDRSIVATKAGGTIAVIGILAGGVAKVSTVSFMMRRQRLAGILVDCRESFERMIAFFESKKIEPVIDARYAFDKLPDAFAHLESGTHFGKIVVEV